MLPQTLAVLACDPRSPLTGGALLGDRFRMPASPEDDGVFIRSLAAASGQGSVAGNLPLMIHLLKAFGFDWVVIETVGAGQGDTGVRDLADVVVLLMQPETGDDLQWEKAGLLEVADIIVVHKADLPGSERTEAQIRDILGLSARKTAKVVRASSKSGKGIEELWQAIRNVGQTIRVLRYHDIGPLSHSEAEAIFDSGDVRQMATALVALGLHDHDWKWVQEQCLRFLSHESEVMVSAAIVSLGHTARINRTIDKDVVLPALQSVAVDPRFTGKVQDALDDIDLFAMGS